MPGARAHAADAAALQATPPSSGALELPASWLDQVERFFALVTEKAIRRGSFRSVNELVAKIDHFVTHYNEHCKPVFRTDTADSVLEKLERLTPRISGTGH